MRKAMSILLTLILILAVLPAALAEELPLPPAAPEQEALPEPPAAPEQEEAPEPPAASEQAALPGLPQATEIPPLPLPNPGSFLGGDGIPGDAAYAYDGATWEVRYYSMGADWGDQVTSWLQACAAAGYRWTPGRIDGQTAYTVTAPNGLRAILVPNYGDYVMLMRQPELEMEAYAAPAAQELSLGQIRLSYNGRSYGVLDVDHSFVKVLDSYATTLDLEGTAVSYNRIDFYVPTVWRTGDKLHIDREHGVPGFKLTLGYDYRVYDEFGNLGMMQNATDHCDVEIFYADDAMLWGSIDGVFQSGEETISLEFFLPIA